MENIVTSKFLGKYLSLLYHILTVEIIPNFLVFKADISTQFLPNASGLTFFLAYISHYSTYLWMKSLLLCPSLDRLFRRYIKRRQLKYIVRVDTINGSGLYRLIANSFSLNSPIYLFLLKRYFGTTGSLADTYL